MRLKGAVGRGLSLLLLGSSLACAGCSSNGNDKDDSGTSNPGPVETNVVKGKVVDTAGKPLAGAEVVADNQVLYDSNVVGTTGADGTYRLDLGKAAVTWNASARFQRQYNGKTYTFNLHPSNPASFATNEGAVRDFSWKLTGEKPDGGNYGSPVLFNMVAYENPQDPDTALDSLNVELTLTPSGPLVDGSTGSPVTAHATRDGNGTGLHDIAVGRYTITARYAPSGKAAQPLVVRVNNTGSYASSVTADFAAVTEGVYRIDLDVDFPK
ncbi:carboxypeptidase-like regulatory domain-containing protein [Pyxidicoccus parkwayensis]|jgi:Carboxypeptidase regulatory-like domain|nr:carboxypeptidase-like regulatory domain-containing protein [Pyxidicoccus parkwaysis]